MSEIQTTSCYMGDHRVLTQTRHGVRLFLDTRDIILTPIVILKGEWEPETTQTLLRVLKPGMNFVDVGANMGYFTCLAAQLVRPEGGKVWAFEADPETFEFLTDNVNLNWFFAGVQLENVAVYSENTQLTLYRRHKYKGNTSIGSVSASDLTRIFDQQTPVQVKAVSLDAYFEAINERIDVLKIDVEGAEPYVLRGMRRIVHRFPKMQIMIEWSPGQVANAGGDPKELLSFFKEHEYRCQLIGQDLVSIDPDRLIEIEHGMVLLNR